MQDPSDFRDAVMAVKFLFLVEEGEPDDEGYSAHLNDPDRETEAAAVESCVECLIDYELDPPKHGKGVGRYGPVSILPPLGQLLGRKLEALDEEQVLKVRHAIRAALAMGYMGAVLVETEMIPEGPPPTAQPADTWRQWVAQLNSDVLSASEDSGNLRDLYCTMAREQFTMQLETGDLVPKRRKRKRLAALGWWYGEAGMLLRLAQTGVLKLDPISAALAQADRWPFKGPAAVATSETGEAEEEPVFRCPICGREGIEGYSGHMKAHFEDGWRRTGTATRARTTRSLRMRSPRRPRRARW